MYGRESGGEYSERAPEEHLFEARIDKGGKVFHIDAFVNRRGSALRICEDHGRRDKIIVPAEALADLVRILTEAQARLKPARA